jgi:hypothetical protein
MSGTDSDIDVTGEAHSGEAQRPMPSHMRHPLSGRRPLLAARRKHARLRRAGSLFASLHLLQPREPAGRARAPTCGPSPPLTTTCEPAGPAGARRPCRRHRTRPQPDMHACHACLPPTPPRFRPRQGLHRGHGHRLRRRPERRGRPRLREQERPQQRQAEAGRRRAGRAGQPVRCTGGWRHLCNAGRRRCRRVCCRQRPGQRRCLDDRQW